MDFTILLSLSVIIFLIGLLIRFTIWFTQTLHKKEDAPTAPRRLLYGLGGILSTIFSLKILSIIQSFVLDLVFQKRIFDKNLYRWITHGLIFIGFVLLFLMHALDSVISEQFFSDYQSTLSPFLQLRNLFGLMVLIGIGMAVYRRISLKNKRLRSDKNDWSALIFITVIMVSGILLEGAKISSYTTYQDMVEEYGSMADEQEEQALEAYWVQENGLVSPNFKQSPTADLVVMGQDLHSDSCMDCHASNKNAFISYSLAPLTRPLSTLAGDALAVKVFWYLHILSCLLFLAWLPFSKMFHIISAPISLLIKRASPESLDNTENSLNRQMVGLSACTHCGTCSLECSSSMFFEYFDNEFILPSEKVQYLKKYAAGELKDPEILQQMQQGLYVCTSCDRCTTSCPSGINLKEIFISARYGLLASGQPETTLLSHFSFPLALAQNFVDDHLQALKKVTNQFLKNFKHLADTDEPITLSGPSSIKNTSFNGCYSCQRCSNVCPVVRSFDNPGETLGLLPHQIMFALGIGDTDLAMGSQMIWSCSTCYLCQEHCPNQVELCDIFYSLKNKALNTIEAGANS